MKGMRTVVLLAAVFAGLTTLAEAYNTGRVVSSACKPTPCGINANCEVINEFPICTCLPGYLGSPYAACRQECENDSDCSSHLACSSNYKCESPCNKCGEGANCDVVNHQPKCTCPSNWLGNPYTRCYPECTLDSECSGSKTVCLHKKCVNNPCDGSCGTNANCELPRDSQKLVICSCPKNTFGNPFLTCHPFDPVDLCSPKTCGENAICTPGHDYTGNSVPVCTCPTGYTQYDLIECRRWECQVNSECPENGVCINNLCQKPCKGKECDAIDRCESG